MLNAYIDWKTGLVKILAFEAARVVAGLSYGTLYGTPKTSTPVSA
jgi:hypothetical protein